MVGVMWYQDGPKTDLATRVTGACQAHHRRLGRWPNTVLVHPSAAVEEAELRLELGGAERPVRVIPDRTVLQHHYYALHLKEEA